MGEAVEKEGHITSGFDRFLLNEWFNILDNTLILKKKNVLIACRELDKNIYATLKFAE